MSATTHGIACSCGQTFQTTDTLEDHVAAHHLDPRDRSTRPPTEDELADLVHWYSDTYQMDRQDAVATINQCTYIVIEDYTTGCPGYAGRVLIEVGSAGPAYHAVYIWQDDTLQRRDQAADTRDRGAQ